MKLGDECWTLKVHYHPARYASEDDFPDGAVRVDGRFLAREGDVIAMVLGNGKILFRPSKLVFTTNEEEAAYTKGKEYYDLDGYELERDLI